MEHLVQFMVMPDSTIIRKGLYESEGMTGAREVRGCYQTWSEGVGCGGAGNGEQPKLLLLPPGGGSSWHF